MESKSSVAWWIVLTSSVLGIGADYLLNGQSLGLNCVVVLIVGLAATEELLRKFAIPFRHEARVLLWASVPFVAFVAWRDSTTLVEYDLFAVAAISLLTVLRCRSGAFSNASVTEFILNALPITAKALFGFVSLFRRDIDWIESSKPKSNKNILTGVRGILISIPFMLLFGSLFESADAEFRIIVQHLFNWNFQEIWSHIFVTALCFVLSSGALKLLLTWQDDRKQVDRPLWFRMGSGEVFILLGALNVLFLSFVVVQFRFLFGSHTAIRLATGMSYAEYARSGFFELVWVTLLILPILLLLDWLVINPTRRETVIFRALTAVLIALLFVVMFSAMHRMHLYVTQFGLTTLRLYVTAFMAWLAIVFVIFVATVMIGKRHQFAFGTVVAALIVICGLNILNPDGYVVHYNRMKVHPAAGLDVDYVQSLSADAVPEEMNYVLGSTDLQKRAELATYLLQMYRPRADENWRSWNWSRRRAKALVGRNTLILTKDAALSAKSSCGC
jgi:hypothetical protein